MIRFLIALAMVGAIAGAPSAADAEESVAPDAIAAPADSGDKAEPSGDKKKKTSSVMQLVVILSVASLLPALVLTCTCFIRFAVVFSFVRTGLATQGAPPNQVLVGMALFMTMFVMMPVATTIHETAVKPYLAGDMNEKQAMEAATPTLRRFLLERTRHKDLELFYDVSDAERPATADDVPLRIAIPAFVLSEIGVAFRIGLIILLPFLVIDLIVASVLSALGMIMLPPPIVSLPIKLLVFVAIDGWHLVVSSLLRGVI